MGKDECASGWDAGPACRLWYCSTQMRGGKEEGAEQGMFAK